MTEKQLDNFLTKKMRLFYFNVCQLNENTDYNDWVKDINKTADPILQQMKVKMRTYDRKSIVKVYEEWKSDYREVFTAMEEIKISHLRKTLEDAIFKICELCLRLNPQYMTCSRCEKIEVYRKVLREKL